MPKAIVAGVGPDQGLGAQLCHRFAAKGLHVIVAGRTGEKIEAVADAIKANGGRATACVADSTSEADTVKLFDAAGDDLHLAIYNTGNNTPGKIIDMEADYFEDSWRVVCYGGFLFGREALRRMVPKGDGVLLYTGASASLRGRPMFGAFNSSKAALRGMVQAMAKEYGPDGIHVGHVVVDGPIGGDKIKSKFPEYAEQLGDDGMIAIDGIVDAFEYLYDQPKRAWSFEVDVRTSLEKW